MKVMILIFIFQDNVATIIAQGRLNAISSYVFRAKGPASVPAAGAGALPEQRDEGNIFPRASPLAGFPSSALALRFSQCFAGHLTRGVDLLTV